MVEALFDGKFAIKSVIKTYVGVDIRNTFPHKILGGAVPIGFLEQ